MNKMYTTPGARRNPIFYVSRIIIVALLCFGFAKSWGQLSITALPADYSNNFNSYNPTDAITLPSTANSTGTGSNINNLTSSGWTGSGSSVYNGQGTGSSATGGFYGFGASSNFSLGALRTGSIVLVYTISFTNNSGSTINSITIAWDYRQYRFVNTSGWDCTGTGALATNATVNGKDFSGSSTGTNGSATTVPSFTLTGLSIANGASFGISWATTDVPGSDNGVAIDNFSLTAFNQLPIVTTSIGTAAFTEGNNVTSTPVAIDNALTVTDADNTNLASATVSISSGLQTAEDVLGFSTQNGITGTYNSATGVLSLTGSATVANYQTALRTVTYTNSSNTPNTANRTISFVASDGTANSTAATKTVSITAVNDDPIITSNGGGATASIDIPENTTAVTTVTATDADGITPTYSLNGGADADKFSITSGGVLTFKTAQSFEVPTDLDGNNTYIVIVRATDGIGNDDQIITVTVTDVTVQTYFSKTTGDLSDVATWGINADGTGTNPPNFTDFNQVFNLTNRTGVVDLSTSAAAIAMGGQLNINSTITNLQAAGKLIIKSSTTGTGRIGQLAGTTITGNVTVERYIPAAGYRAYRILAPSVNTTTSIKENWQEGSSNPDVATNVNGTNIINGQGGTGYGTHITGPAADAGLGFDPTQNGNRSLYTYNGTAYTAVTSTISTNLDAKTGYLLFVRGDRSTIDRLNGSTINGSGNTVLRATGTLLTGNQLFTLNGDNNFTLIANPYASPISWSRINPVASPIAGISSSYTYVDPRVGLQGAYVTVSNTGTTSTPGVTPSEFIQSGQAFFVKSDATSSPLSITITEAHKASPNNVNVFRTGSQEQLSIGLYFDLNGAKRIADGVNILFHNDYFAAVDGNDAEQITNFDEDISIKRSDKFLAIEGRPLIDGADTIFLNMTHMKQKEYTFEFNPASFNAPGLLAYLQDKFLESETQISLTEQTIVPFTVSRNTASSARDRFRVVFKNATVLPINFTNVKAFEKGKDIQVEWNLGNEQNMKHYEVEKSTDGRIFTKAGMQTARTFLITDNYQWLDQQPNAGNNFYRIKAIEKSGTFKYSPVVNVKVGKGNSAITVYPNPVTDNVISLQLINQPKGKYSIRLLNQLGQEVYRKELNHIGGSATETLQLNKKIARGLYNLQVNSETNTSIQQVVLN